MTVASSGQGPIGCKGLSSGPLIKGRTPRMQSSRFLWSLHPCGVSRMIPGPQTVKYTCFYGFDPLSISLTPFSISLHTPSFLNSLWPTPMYFPPSQSNCHLLSFYRRPLWASFFQYSFSLHIDADHTGILFQAGSWIHNGSPRWPREGYLFYKGLSLCLTPIETSFLLLSGERSGQPYTWQTGWLSSPSLPHQGLPLPSPDFKAKRLISCGPWKRGTQFQIQLHIPFEWN